MCFSNDGRFLITCGIDGGVRMWQTDLARCLVSYRSFSMPAWCVRFHPKNRCFCVCTEGCMAFLYNTDDVQFVRRFMFSYSDITCCEWMPTNPNCFILGMANGDLYMCNAEWATGAVET